MTVYSLIQQRRLKLFGHIARAAASEDHSRALRASTDPLPVDWRRPTGRPRQSWLRTIDSDLKPLNLGLHSVLRRATDRSSWRCIVETAMLFERATWWWWWWCRYQTAREEESGGVDPWFGVWPLNICRRGQYVLALNCSGKNWLY